MECNTCGRGLYNECEACSKCKQPVCFEGECLDEINVDGEWVELCGPCQEGAVKHATEDEVTP